MGAAYQRPLSWLSTSRATVVHTAPLPVPARSTLQCSDPDRLKRGPPAAAMPVVTGEGGLPKVRLVVPPAVRQLG